MFEVFDVTLTASLALAVPMASMPTSIARRCAAAVTTGIGAAPPRGSTVHHPAGGPCPAVVHYHRRDAWIHRRPTSTILDAVLYTTHMDMVSHYGTEN